MVYTVTLRYVTVTQLATTLLPVRNKSNGWRVDVSTPRRHSDGWTRLAKCLRSLNQYDCTAIARLYHGLYWPTKLCSMRVAFFIVICHIQKPKTDISAYKPTFEAPVNACGADYCDRWSHSVVCLSVCLSVTQAVQTKSSAIADEPPDACARRCFMLCCQELPSDEWLRFIGRILRVLLTFFIWRH